LHESNSGFTPETALFGENMDETPSFRGAGPFENHLRQYEPDNLSPILLGAD
jgi:hypothetical protein